MNLTINKINVEDLMVLATMYLKEACEQNIDLHTAKDNAKMDLFRAKQILINREEFITLTEFRDLEKSYNLDIPVLEESIKK